LTEYPKEVCVIVMQDGRVFEAKEENDKKFPMIKLTPAFR
jgi:hypothetical protein